MNRTNDMLGSKISNSPAPASLKLLIVRSEGRRRKPNTSIFFFKIQGVSKGQQSLGTTEVGVFLPHFTNEDSGTQRG